MGKVRFIRLNAQAKTPVYANNKAAGADLFSTENKIIPAGGIALIKTGLAMEIPDGYVGLLYDRSGMAYKNGIARLAGVIDSDYRGEVGCVFYNTKATDYFIAQGDKIIQMLIQKAPQFEFEEVMDLAETDRGSKGFGSTGST